MGQGAVVVAALKPRHYLVAVISGRVEGGVRNGSGVVSAIIIGFCAICLRLDGGRASSIVHWAGLNGCAACNAIQSGIADGHVVPRTLFIR